MCVFSVQCDNLHQKIADLRQLLSNKDNESVEKMREQMNSLQQQSLKLFEMAYKKVSDGVGMPM